MSAPTRNDLLITMQRVGVVLKESGAPFALAGSMAVWARGGHTSDHDVDFLIRERDVDRVLKAMREAHLRTERPPEDWLVKVYDGDLLVDLIHRPVERPVTDATLRDADVIRVHAVALPVLSATELAIHKLLTFDEHACDFATGLPMARSLREQVDWARVRDEVSGSSYAMAFLRLLELLEVVPPAGTAGVTAEEMA